MNAAQQKSNQYDRAKAPINSSPLRLGKVQKIEHLDERRSKKLREAVEIRRLEDERKRICELERYYNLKPAKHFVEKNKNSEQASRRKLTSAYVFAPSPSPTKKAQEKQTGQYVAKKRLVFSEITPHEGVTLKESLLLKTKSVSSMILSILVVFLMLSCILIKQAEISNQTYLNSQMEKEIDSLNIELSKLNMNHALKEDLTSVQYSAALKGMARPSDSQVVFVSINPLPGDNSIAEAQDSKAQLAEEDIGVSVQNDSVSKNSSGLIDDFSNFFKKSGETVKGWID